MSLYIFDLDGVIYIEETLLSGAKEALTFLKERGDEVSFLSNNSTLSRTGFVKKLGQMGIKVSSEEIFSSSYLAAIYLSKNKHKRENRVFPIGEAGLFQELRKAGINITSRIEEINCVVVGMDRKFNFKKLLLAHRAILKGAKFIATNKDATYPVEKGTAPGAGAIIKALEASTDKKALLLGKPCSFGIKAIMKSKGHHPRDTILVGDRLETDIRAGKRLGITTILVLSGITSQKMLQKAPPSLMPDYVIHSLSELFSLKIVHCSVREHEKRINSG